jgi:putative hydrolase of the HAD superfamily
MSADVDPDRVECVLFDLYCTLVDVQIDEDTPALWAGLRAALEATEASADPIELRRRFQRILKEEAERGREGFIMESVFARFLASYEADADVARIGGLFRQLSLTTLTLRPYVVPLFDALRRSHTRIGIVSNTEAVLTRYDLDRFPTLLAVGAIVLSSEVGVRKPDPRIFRVALDRLQSQPACAVFVGDSWTDDIVGACSIGMRAIYLDAPTIAGVESSGNRVLRAAPTLASIIAALRVHGWTERAAASGAE